MSLPQQAGVEPTPQFLDHLDRAGEFFLSQDTASAPQRFARLQQEIQEALTLLAWSPGSGRRARFFDARSAQGRLRALHLQQLAHQAGLPNLREWPLKEHLLLYAHNEQQVLLLALRAQASLRYPG